VSVAPGVGPILRHEGPTAGVIEALRRLNPRMTLLDRGAYVRVQVPRRCVLTRAAVEEELGRPFRLPGDLEPLMPSFQGRMTLTADEVVWEGAPLP